MEREIISPLPLAKRISRLSVLFLLLPLMNELSLFLMLRDPKLASLRYAHGIDILILFATFWSFQCPLFPRLSAPRPDSIISKPEPFTNGIFPLLWPLLLLVTHSQSKREVLNFARFMMDRPRMALRVLPPRETFLRWSRSIVSQAERILRLFSPIRP